MGTDHRDNPSYKYARCESLVKPIIRKEKRTKHLLVVVVSAIALSGCNHLGTRSDLPVAAEVSSIRYVLPDTRAKIEVTLTLESCANGKLKARAKVSITPFAVASDPDDNLEFVLYGSDLKAFWKKRDLKVELHPHGGLKSINATTKDASAGIIGGFIKLVAAAAAPETATTLNAL